MLTNETTNHHTVLNQGVSQNYNAITRFSYAYVYVNSIQDDNLWSTMRLQNVSQMKKKLVVKQIGLCLSGQSISMH